MAKQYSIAEARKSFPSVVSEAQAGIEIRLTRRGKPVTVMLSLESFDRLSRQRRSFSEAYRAFRKEFPEGARGVEPGTFRSLRDRGPGRKVSL